MRTVYDRFRRFCQTCEETAENGACAISNGREKRAGATAYAFALSNTRNQFSPQTLGRSAGFTTFLSAARISP